VYSVRGCSPGTLAFVVLTFSTYPSILPPELSIVRLYVISGRINPVVLISQVNLATNLLFKATNLTLFGALGISITQNM